MARECDLSWFYGSHGVALDILIWPQRRTRLDTKVPSNGIHAVARYPPWAMTAALVVSFPASSATIKPKTLHWRTSPPVFSVAAAAAAFDAVLTGLGVAGGGRGNDAIDR